MPERGVSATPTVCLAAAEVEVGAEGLRTGVTAVPEGAEKDDLGRRAEGGGIALSINDVPPSAAPPADAAPVARWCLRALSGVELSLLLGSAGLM
jgi:hypothetical protein